MAGASTAACASSSDGEEWHVAGETQERAQQHAIHSPEGSTSTEEPSLRGASTSGESTSEDEGRLRHRWTDAQRHRQDRGEHAQPQQPHRPDLAQMLGCAAHKYHDMSKLGISPGLLAGIGIFMALLFWWSGGKSSELAIPEQSMKQENLALVNLVGADERARQVLNELNPQRFTTFGQVMAFQCQRDKIPQTFAMIANDIPSALIENLTQAILAMDDGPFVFHERRYGTDGTTGEGFQYDVKLLTRSVGDTLAVAIRVAGTSFRVDEVVVGFKEERRPIKLERRVRGRLLCRAKCGFFSPGCTEGSEDHGAIYEWRNEEYVADVQVTQKPIFDRDVLPEGMSNNDLMEALVHQTAKQLL